MNIYNLSEEEKAEIRKQHEEATKKVNDRKEELKKGLQKPEPKKDK